MDYVPRSRQSGRASATLAAGSPPQRVRAGSGDQPLWQPVLDVDEANRNVAPEDADVVERAAVELHVGEVLEQAAAWNSRVPVASTFPRRSETMEI